MLNSHTGENGGSMFLQNMHTYQMTWNYNEENCSFNANVSFITCKSHVPSAVY